MQILHAPRIGKSATLMVGCAVVIFDPPREKILLTRRADNNRWCLPGGRMEPGESAAEAAQREAWEETGLRVAVTRLVGIYTNPHHPAP
jgi:8-oxo-dGTP pyrophosphatase MutT (NUDIX family)